MQKISKDINNEKCDCVSFQKPTEQQLALNVALMFFRFVLFYFKKIFGQF